MSEANRISTWEEMEEVVRNTHERCVISVVMNRVPSLDGMVRLVVGAKGSTGEFRCWRSTRRPIEVSGYVLDVLDDLMATNQITEAEYVGSLGGFFDLDWAAKCAARDVEARLRIERRGKR